MRKIIIIRGWIEEAAQRTRGTERVENDKLELPKEERGEGSCIALVQRKAFTFPMKTLHFFSCTATDALPLLAWKSSR